MSELVDNRIQKRESSLMPANLNWIGVRSLDPIGKVFQKGDYYYRAIYPHQASFVERLLSSPALEKMTHAGLMTPQIRSKQQVEGFAFCVKSKAADWVIPPAHWTLGTLKQAAINWLAINLALLESGYQLIDAHHGNYVLGENCNPQWIDLGSIQKDSSYVLTGFQEFCQRQLYPLVVLSLRPDLSSLLKRGLMEQGLTYRELVCLIPLSLKAKIAGWINLINKKKVRRGARLKHKTVLWAAARLIHSLPMATHKTFWAYYHGRNPTLNGSNPSAGDPRMKIVMQLVGVLNPGSILDMGANSGKLLALLGAPGRKLLAVDPDEHAIEKFVTWANGKHTGMGAAVGCVGNFHTITARAELVLGMALTHHLALTEQFKFDYISKRFAELSTQFLITEFMPNGLGVMRKQEGLPVWYSFENFISELKKYWSEVETVKYDFPKDWSPRTMILCKNKI
jgi:hypothetical protein